MSTARLLIVDDEQPVRNLLREHLKDLYEIIDTGDPADALALALQHKPDCILLDLMMPGYTGFELCQTLSYHSATRLIPIFVISGNSAEEYKEFCLNLGARQYFQKPVDFKQLKSQLDEAVKQKPPERRSEVRLRLRVVLKLVGADSVGKGFEVVTATDDVSVSGFLCGCLAALEMNTVIQVSLMGGGEHKAGKARVVRAEWQNTPWQRYGFQFVEKPKDWILR